MRYVLAILALAVAACGANADVLWDQITNSQWVSGFSSQDCDPAYDTWDTWAADDFVVDASGWEITGCDWVLELSFGFGYVEHVNFYVWPDRGDGHADLENPIFVASNVYGDFLFPGEYHHDFTNATTLDPGEYFFGVQIAMSYTSYGNAFWSGGDLGEQDKYFEVINPLGGRGYGTEWFEPLGLDISAMFRLYGQALQQKIDIKPGSDPNTINLGSNGVIPVAIFSFPDFDATDLDPATIELAGSGVAVRGNGKKYLSHEEDVNSDGLMDLVVKVETENLDPGLFQDGYAILTGTTYAGDEFEGSDEITIVPPG